MNAAVFPQLQVMVVRSGHDQRHAANLYFPTSDYSLDQKALAHATGAETCQGVTGTPVEAIVNGRPFRSAC